jgi:hypothetical protein
MVCTTAEKRTIEESSQSRMHMTIRPFKVFSSSAGHAAVVWSSPSGRWMHWHRVRRAQSLARTNTNTNLSWQLRGWRLFLVTVPAALSTALCRCFASTSGAALLCCPVVSHRTRTQDNTTHHTHTIKAGVWGGGGEREEVQSRE